MVVVDTNIIAYLYLPADNTKFSEQLVHSDRHWAAPILWKSEFRNILATYLRKGILDLPAALEIQTQAEDLMMGSDFDVDSAQVLSLADESGCTAYDCEFVSLAQSLSIPLVTTDRKLAKSFPDIAYLLRVFVKNDR